MSPRRTIARTVTVSGTALHAGVPVTMTLSPAAGGQGIVFRRTDLNLDIPARYDLVSETRLGTVIGLAYVRRGSQEPGTMLEVAAEGGKRAAEVASLPFSGAL